MISSLDLDSGVELCESNYTGFHRGIALMMDMGSTVNRVSQRNSL